MLPDRAGYESPSNINAGLSFKKTAIIWLSPTPTIWLSRSGANARSKTQREPTSTLWAKSTMKLTTANGPDDLRQPLPVAAKGRLMEYKRKKGSCIPRHERYQIAVEEPPPPVLRAACAAGSPSCPTAYTIGFAKAARSVLHRALMILGRIWDLVLQRPPTLPH